MVSTAQRNSMPKQSLNPARAWAQMLLSPHTSLLTFLCCSLKNARPVPPRMTTALLPSNTVMPSTLVCSTLTWEILVCFSSLPERIWALSSHTSRKCPRWERGVKAASQLRHFSGSTETGFYPFKKGKGVEPRSPYVLNNYINH